MDRTLAFFGGDDEVSNNRTPCAAGNGDPRGRGSGLSPAEERRGSDPASRQTPIQEMGHPQGQGQRIFEPWRDRFQGSFRRGRCHRPDLAEFHRHVSSKKGNSHPKNIEVWVYLLEVNETLSDW